MVILTYPVSFSYIACRYFQNGDLKFSHVATNPRTCHLCRLTLPHLWEITQFFFFVKMTANDVVSIILDGFGFGAAGEKFSIKILITTPLGRTRVKVQRLQIYCKSLHKNDKSTYSVNFKAFHTLFVSNSILTTA